MKPNREFYGANSSPFGLGPRRGIYYDISQVLQDVPLPVEPAEIDTLEQIDLVYRTLCGILYNFVPTSGHPGGSISSGRIVEGLLYRTMDYNFHDPEAEDADVVSYAAGHKAMGLYAMWALRNEMVRIGRPDLLPEVSQQLRLEDLLGFRRNPTHDTPLFRKFKSKALDGHPTPTTPFVRLATGASGVGVPASLGLAMAALDIYRENPPWVHILEGEGGMTPGRVHEALAAAATARLHNAVLHVDWNQASIDSNHVCREDEEPGDYVQWNPVELAYVHDWNVIFVPNGFDFRQVLAAQELALALDTRQPTAIVYRTVKGWKYGIQGKASHGAGHKFCSEDYYRFLGEFEEAFGVRFPRFEGEPTPENIERTFFDTLMVIRHVLESNRNIADFAAERVSMAWQRLQALKRRPHARAPRVQRLYDRSSQPQPEEVPEALRLEPGQKVTLRAVLGDALNVLNSTTGGAVIGAAADLLNSTSVSALAKGFPEGWFNAVSNPDARLVAVGGICEDAMGAWMAGLSTFGHHIGVSSSYGAFIGALEHVAARLHGIGQQARYGPHAAYRTWIMINAHAGVKTGEDGPTHADPQVLQLLQENFPNNVLITLTPWDPQEIWPLLVAGLLARPAILAPFVTRPPEQVVDRAALGLPPVTAAVKGVYAMRQADLDAREYHGTLVLQGNGVASAFVHDVLPKLEDRGINMNVYYVASTELFNRLPADEQARIFPEALAREAMGITDFTLPTMYRWVRWNEGLRRTLHSFRDGHYLGSGQAHRVLHEAGIDAEGQLRAILDYALMMEKRQRTAGRRYAPPVDETTGRFPEVMLACSECGAQIDPRDYFSADPLPTEEICLECEWRSPEACASCRAYWLLEKGEQVLCSKCEAKVALE